MRIEDIEDIEKLIEGTPEKSADLTVAMEKIHKSIWTSSKRNHSRWSHIWQAEGEGSSLPAQLQSNRSSQ